MKKYLYNKKFKKYSYFIVENNISKIIKKWIENISWEPDDVEWNINIIKHLIECEVDVNILDNEGYSALHNFSADGIDELVELLLNKKNIDINYINPNSNTALNIASWNNNINIVKMLLKHPKIDINIKDDENKNFIEIFKSQYIYQDLIDYDLQKEIIKNGRDDIIIFLDKYELIHPDIKKEYSELFKAADWGLL